ncbi:unnamed protein product [Acanthosepion pharaonis]|uniref:Reverse transcriptase domain-containing protein n=1 Tax=Acanthosepion pharaonis TaxID=158019 RepID=A0A812EBQ4_ACAPH|nr:unnamed protein product [Sepia pharaonis]
MLIASDNIISSATGIQQGDPLGPLLFAMSIDGVARSIASPFNIWYLDDATLGGSIEAVAAELRRVIPALSLLGLEINSSNHELIDEILGGSSQCFSGSSFEHACSVWAQELLSLPPDTSKQKSWEKIKCEANFINLRLSLWISIASTVYYLLHNRLVAPGSTQCPLHLPVPF